MGADTGFPGDDGSPGKPGEPGPPGPDGMDGFPHKDYLSAKDYNFISDKVSGDARFHNNLSITKTKTELDKVQNLLVDCVDQNDISNCLTKASNITCNDEKCELLPNYYNKKQLALATYNLQADNNALNLRKNTKTTFGIHANGALTFGNSNDTFYDPNNNTCIVKFINDECKITGNNGQLQCTNDVCDLYNGVLNAPFEINGPYGTEILKNGGMYSKNNKLIFAIDNKLKIRKKNATKSNIQFDATRGLCLNSECLDTKAAEHLVNREYCINNTCISHDVFTEMSKEHYLQNKNKMYLSEETFYNVHNIKPFPNIYNKDLCCSNYNCYKYGKDLIPRISNNATSRIKLKFKSI